MSSEKHLSLRLGSVNSKNKCQESSQSENCELPCTFGLAEKAEFWKEDVWLKGRVV